MKLPSAALIPAGGMIAADLKTGKFYDHKEIVDYLAAQAPYEEWLSAVTELEPDIGVGEEPPMFASEELLRRQTAAGYTLETLELILSPMVESGQGSHRFDGRRHGPGGAVF